MTIAVFNNFSILEEEFHDKILEDMPCFLKEKIY